MDTKWLTYRELAEALGIAHDSARRLANRNKLWPRQIGNDGMARIGVPVERLPERKDVVVPAGVDQDAGTGDGEDAPLDASAATLRIIAALDGHIETLRDQLAKAEAMTERERERADRLQAEALNSAKDAFTAALERDRLRLDLDAAEKRIGALEATRSRPWWRRISAA